jgi:cytochrome bd-type quinol oxidase subunit 2
VSFLRNHIVLMFIYAAATAAFFSLLWKHERRERIRSFAVIFCALFLGGIALGWLMFPFPLGR